MIQTKAADNPKEFATSEFGDGIRDVDAKLPEALRRLLAPHEEVNEYVTSLMTTLTVTGGLIPEVWSTYDRRPIHAMLMFFAICPPAGGKGIVNLSSILLEQINRYLSDTYKTELTAYQHAVDVYRMALKDGKADLPPAKPKRSQLLVPGNISSTKLIQQMADNRSLPLVVIETEADVVAGSFKSDYGQLLSTLMRQAYHHERISFARKTNDEYMEVEKPKMAMVIAGTDSQVTSIFAGNHDGLFSRFMFLRNAVNVGWRSVKPLLDATPLDDHFREWSKWFLAVWKQTRDLHMEITLTEAQWDSLDKFGRQHQAIAHVNGGDYSISIARRHALMVVRMAMVLTLFRHTNPDTALVNKNAEKWICSDEDFEVALTLGEISFHNSLGLFKVMPQPRIISAATARRMAFLKALPENFTIQEANMIAQSSAIPDRTKTRWMRELCDTGILEHTAHGKYRKTDMADVALLTGSQE